MKIHNPIGSKERFLEMFQGVNKVNLNEVATGVMQSGTQLVVKAFEELKTKQAQIKQTNTQTINDENFIEIITNDQDGNEITFIFKINSTEGDQDGVFNIGDVVLTEFKIKSATLNVEMPENMQAVQDFNASHGDEIMDVVGEYANFETDNVSVDDEVYNEAVKLIDKVPFKKGTEQMQTNKAYADQKPTNPDVRVKSDELDKFVSEIKDYNENLNSLLHTPGAAGAGYLYPQAKEMGVTNQYILTDALKEIGVEINNILTVSDKFRIDLIHGGKPHVVMLKKDYGSAAKVRDLVKKKLGLTETEDYVNNEYTQTQTSPKDTLADSPEYNITDLPKDSDADNGSEIGIDPYDQLDLDNDEPLESVSPKKAAVINQAYDNIVAAGNQSPTMPEIMAEIDRLQGNVTPLKKTRTIPKGAEEFWEGENKSVVTDMNEDADKIAKDYPDQMGKKFKPKNQMPKKKRKPHSVVKLSEEDEIPQEYWGNPEDEIAEGEDVAVDTEPNNIIDGGLADDEHISEFNSQQIMIGMGIEMEHTDDPKIALEIAMDHLTEIPDYYTRLDAMEKEAGVEEPVEGMMDKTPEDEETTDELLGYKPHNVNDYTSEEFDYAAVEREYHDKEDMRQHPEDYEGNEHPLADVLDSDGTEEDLSKQNTGAKSVNKALEEEDGFDEYTGEIGDRYADGEGNQFTVRDKVKGGVTLQGQRGEKEIATRDIQFLKKLSEEKVEGKEVITEEQVKTARFVLKNRITEGMTKKEAVQILIKHNIK